MSWFSRKEELKKAEEYIASGNGIWSHYSTQAVQDILRGKVGNRGKIANISDREVEEIVKKIGEERG